MAGRIKPPGSSSAKIEAIVAMLPSAVVVCYPRCAPPVFQIARKAAIPQFGRPSRPLRGDDMDLKAHIRTIPDFPKPGILFYDIWTLLAHPGAWRATVEQMAEAVRPLKPDLLVGIESRGFLVAAPLALVLGSGFAMVRKKGKLPGRTVRFTYELEYGTDTIEMQEDAIPPGQRRPAGVRRPGHDHAAGDDQPDRHRGEATAHNSLPRRIAKPVPQSKADEAGRAGRYEGREPAADRTAEAADLPADEAHHQDH